jgi:hypothetical protein
VNIFKMPLIFFTLTVGFLAYGGLKVSAHIPIDKGGVQRATQRCMEALDKQCRDNGKSGINQSSVSTVESGGNLRCAGECK